jgi:drug/metabolite transporter (DMT)-like permease
MSIAFVPGHSLAALLGIEVFVAALCGWWLLSEVPSVETWIGGTLTLSAATWQILASAKATSLELD